MVDSNDPSYYVDPAGTGIINDLDVRGWLYNGSGTNVRVNDDILAKSLIDANATSYYVDPSDHSVIRWLDVRENLSDGDSAVVTVDDGLVASYFGVGGTSSNVAYYATGKTYGVYADVGSGGIGGQFNNTAASISTWIATGSEGLSTNGLINAQDDVDVGGDLNVTGTKNFVQPHPADPDKVIVYTTLEGGEAGTYYRGSARLDQGTAVIELPEHFSLVTEEEGLTVQVTPRENCNGLYVAEVTTTGIVVKELQGGTSNACFDFFINGVRAGYADHPIIQDASEVIPEGASVPKRGGPHE